MSDSPVGSFPSGPDQNAPDTTRERVGPSERDLLRSDRKVIGLSLDWGAERLRPPAEWGRVVADGTSLGVLPEGVPEHVQLHAVTVPEGMLVRAVCSCGGRSEMLVDQRPFVREVASADGTVPEEDWAAALRGARTLEATWVPQHLYCGREHGSPSMPSVLATALFDHVQSAAAALARGESPPSHVALVLQEPTGAQTHRVLPLSGVPDVVVAGAQARDEWIAVHLYKLREVPRGRGVAVAAVALTTAMRRERRMGHPLPAAAIMARDPQTEWQLVVVGITPAFGVVLRTPWGRYDDIVQSLADLEVERLTEPCDVLDGILARPQR